jgi:cytochrome c
VEDIGEGKVTYQGNCAVCHGENLDGKGPAADGFRYPIRPANFRDAGTIAQLTLPYVYWRLVAGGIQNQFNSAMPRWVVPAETPEASSLHGYDLTSDEAWKVIIYLYDATGFEPRKE